MTRLLRGSAVLLGLCAMTLVVGCGGTSSPASTTCDGGACSDAKRDTSGDGNKADVTVSPDVARVDLGPNLDTAPTPIPDAGLPDLPPANTDVPPANADVPPAGADASIDVPPTSGDVPPASVDVAGDGIDAPTPNLDVQPTPDLPPASPDLSPAEVAATPDAPSDTTPAVVDGGLDAPIANPDVPHDSTVVLTDAASDGADSADVLAVVVDASDGGADGIADAPAADASADAVVDSGTGDGGGCSGGDACHAYNFAGDNLDGGMPTGFAAVPAGSPDVWSVVLDGSDKVLRGVGTDTPTYIEVADVTGTDQTIEVRVRLSGAPGALSDVNNNTIRICGRFTASTLEAYCLYVATIASDAGSTGGRMSIHKRRVGDVSELGAAANLDIMVGTWHTYRFSISGSSTVQLKAYLDNAATATISTTDSLGTLTSGGTSVGVRNITAEIESLLVTNP